MLEDDRIRHTLVTSGLATEGRVLELSAAAGTSGRSLYRMAVEDGHVVERDLVSALATSLGVASVSLEHFSGKPELFAILPPPLVKRHRALPVGLKPEGASTTLFVAMEDPHDLDALEAIGQCCTHHVTPVLAGLVDLERAIERIYAPPPEPARIEQTAPPRRGNLDESAPPMFEGFGVAQPPDIASALSMLDDIPRSRHDDVTPVSGIGIERPSAEEMESWAASRPPSREPRDSTDQGVGTVSASRSGFQRSGPASASSRLGWRSRRADEIARALVQVLVAKGVITEDELIEALED